LFHKQPLASDLGDFYSMSFSIENWHQRYLQQARWTADLRKYLYNKSGINKATRILDVGCGTGVLEEELRSIFSGSTFAVDVNLEALEFAHHYAPGSIYTASNGLALPYPRGTFDVSFCHFLLLWVSTVHEMVSEMSRVTKPGGVIVAMAEPDYGGRVDYPDIYSRIGGWQNQSLVDQGANPFIGRQLRSIFYNTGLREIEVGVLGAQWSMQNSSQEDELEWQVLLLDLESRPELLHQAQAIKASEYDPQTTQHKILYVPVFYAFGRTEA
jgi:ubiquinone/menaquinone biosynthesis C-methylase UbiE